MRSVAAACAFALGTWAAFGSVALYGPDTSPRLVLPGSPWILLVAAGVSLAYVLIRRPAAREAALLWLPAVALLPWLPLPIPPAVLLWTGPLARALVLVATVGVVVLDARAKARAYVHLRVRAYARLWRRGDSPAFVAFAVAAALYIGAAWRLSPVLPSGDEPHYLVIAESLLRDGDLRIENNHASRGYLAYVDGELKPDYLRRGRDRQIYSIHAPGLPALILPAFALAGYAGVVVFLALLSAAGTALAWRAAFEVTGDVMAAWVGWAAVALSAPFFFQAFTVFPDAPAAVIVMGVVCALVRESGLTSPRHLALAGAALAILPWLHTRYSLIAAMAAVVILGTLWRRGFSPADRVRSAAAFLAIPLISAIAWLLMFQQIYGTFDPRAPYGGAPEMWLARIPVGLTGLLIDQQFGLMPNAPIYLVGLVTIAALAKQDRRLALELVAIAMPYVVAVAAFHMWWAGLSSPARFLVPVLLPMAIPVAVYWQRHATGTPRAATLALLIASVAISVVLTGAGDGSLLYNTRDGFARWLDWVAPAVNLGYALPSLFQESVAAAWGKAAVWLVAFATGWFALRGLERRSSALSFLAVGLVTIATISLGATGCWLTSGRHGIEAGSSAIATLAAACGHDPLVLRIAPFKVSASRIENAGLTARDAGRRPITTSGPLWTGRDIPPGQYRVWLDSGLNVTGALTIALGKPESTFLQCTFAEHRPGATGCVIDLPAGATWLWMTPDASMRSSVEWLRLQPISMGASDTCDLRADRAVVTPPGVMFAEKGSVYAESTGLWVIGGRTARLMLQPRGQRTLSVRNGPMSNAVRITTGSSQEERHLSPGEATSIQLHSPRSGAVIPVTVSSTAGFRPADWEAGNRDLRHLGVWVELR